MLAIVKDDQGRFRREVVDQRFRRAAPRLFADVDRGHQRLRNDVRIGDRAKFSEPDVRVLFQPLRGQLDGEPSLSNSPCSDKGEEATSGQQGLQFLQFRGAPEEGRELERKIVLSDVQRLEWRERGGRTLAVELAKLLGGWE